MLRRVREAVALLAVIAPVGLLVGRWSRLPATIPVHFGLRGQADGYGSRDWLWMLVGLSVVLYLTLLGVERLRTVRGNLPTRQAGAATPAAQASRRELLGWLRFEVAVLLAYVSCAMMFPGHGLGTWFTFVPLPVFLLTTGFFRMRMRQQEESAGDVTRV